jgi:hypothetical protein
VWNNQSPGTSIFSRDAPLAWMCSAARKRLRFAARRCIMMDMRATAELTSPRLYLSPPHMSGLEPQFVQETSASNWIAPTEAAMQHSGQGEEGVGVVNSAGTVKLLA